MSQVEARLGKLGLALPAAKAPVANYLGTRCSGTVLYASGRVSPQRGKAGRELTLEQAREAAQSALLDLLAIIKADIGDLDRIEAILYMRGFVNSSPEFTAQPQVIDGASDLLIELYGDAGRHARTATGAAQLPYGAAVQLDLIANLKAPV